MQRYAEFFAESRQKYVNNILNQRKKSTRINTNKIRRMKNHIHTHTHTCKQTKHEENAKRARPGSLAYQSIVRRRIFWVVL